VIVVVQMRPSKPQQHWPMPWWHLPEVPRDPREAIPIPEGVYAWREARPQRGCSPNDKRLWGAHLHCSQSLIIL